MRHLIRTITRKKIEIIQKLHRVKRIKIGIVSHKHLETETTFCEGL